MESDQLNKYRIFKIVVCLLLFVGVGKAFAGTVQHPYGSQYPLFEPSGPDFKAVDINIETQLINETGLAGSFGSIDRRYAKGRFPELESITHYWSGVAWRGERVYAQIVLFSKESIGQLRVETTAMVSKGDRSLGLSSLNATFVRYVLDEGVLYPDILDPIKQLDLPANTTRPVWVSMEVPQDAKPGKYAGKLDIVATGEVRLHFVLELEVLPLTLPAPKDWKFYLDLWQNPFAIARWHGVEPWSDEHFQLMAPYWRMLANAGQKCLTLSLFHHPWGAQVYDGYEGMVAMTRKSDGTWEYDFSLLDKYVAFAERVGLDDQINCYSMIPWSNRFRYVDSKTGDWQEIEAEPGQDAYRAIWKPFLQAFEDHVKQKGWEGRVAIAMDERPEKDVLAAQRLIRQYAPSLRIASATNHPPKRFELDDWSPIISEPVAPEILRKRNEIPNQVTTFYVCTVPAKPNTFTHSSLAESAWMGLYAAAENRSGFLRWAYNSWNENPFYDTKYWAKDWPAGDCFLIYPGPRSSMRFERLREGIQDYEKIHLLRKLAGPQENNPDITQAIQDLDKALSDINFQNAKSMPVCEHVNAVKASVSRLSQLLSKYYD